MTLESYTCDLCILQRTETVAHLFLRCNFARACWVSIGITVISTMSILQILKRIKRQLNVSFAMEIIILMTWCIWTTRTDRIFNDINPMIEDCRNKFITEFALLLHRAKHSLLPQMESWLEAL
uniref:Reverse transcriptase zinc-binding domain-containing protein n=1 Tax=Setaria viridis TaxID=4556 RepID=A0A4U6U653_SETVI|nr:hypothetical protein SEVIR_6G208600v2 [Setaria viridis]